MKRAIDRKVIWSGLIGGVIGGLLLILFATVDLNLGDVAGYLFLLSYIFSLYIARRVYEKFNAGVSTFSKRVIAGLLTFFVMTFMLVVAVIYTFDFSYHLEVLPILVHITFGTGLSLLFAIRR